MENPGDPLPHQISGFEAHKMIAIFQQIASDELLNSRLHLFVSLLESRSKEEQENLMEAHQAASAEVASLRSYVEEYINEISAFSSPQEINTHIAHQGSAERPKEAEFQVESTVVDHVAASLSEASSHELSPSNAGVNTPIILTTSSPLFAANRHASSRGGNLQSLPHTHTDLLEDLKQTERFSSESKAMDVEGKKEGALCLFNETPSIGGRTLDDSLCSSVSRDAEEGSFDDFRSCYDEGVIYTDGVYDLIHSGHFNAIRQAKSLGKRLIVGVNSDSGVFHAKGALPIFTQSERAEILRGCKWVDEVIEGTPYNVSLKFLDSTRCEFVAHGDDVAVDFDGNDSYAEPRAAGRLKTFKRTEGVSTTNMIKKLLMASDESNFPVSIKVPTTIQQYINDSADTMNASQMLMSTKRLLQFIGNRTPPKPGDQIVYVDGSFDIFHVGHSKILQKAKELGDYLIVGIHDDWTVRSVKGPGFPVMNLMERALNILAMKFVDEVIIGAPWIITQYLITAFRIDFVVRGTCVDSVQSLASSDSPSSEESSYQDPYQVPKNLKIYREIVSSSMIDTREIIRRVNKNRACLQKSIKSRSLKETNFWATVDHSLPSPSERALCVRQTANQSES